MTTLWFLLFGVGVWIGGRVWKAVYNLFFHPLRTFPGPRLAAGSEWWKTYVEVFKGESWVHVLEELHGVYGDVVRVGPDELHFSNPKAYYDIYHPSLRWDKERILYESFGEDKSSFGLLRYGEAKKRKDVLQPLFSRRAILGMQELVREKADHLIEILKKNQVAGKPSDMLFAFRCFTVDMILDFCFAKSVSAMDEPDFAAPIVLAMDNSLPTFPLFKHFPWFRKTIFSLPPWLAIKASPETAGLTKLQVILGKQIQDVTANPSILESSPHPTIYHRLLDPSVRHTPFFPDSTLIDEALTMLFAGGVTVGDTSMTGFHHILSQPSLYSSLRQEIMTVWPNIHTPPSLEQLESLPLLTATIKESLRIAPGACSPLLRIVPPSGASINGTFVPGGTIVGMSAHFVHFSAIIFPEPKAFKPERWLEKSEKEEGLEKWLVAFSKGPRSCLGINLAWCELYFLFATVVRRLRMRFVDEGRVGEELVWRDCFTPFYKEHLRVWCEGVEE